MKEARIARQSKDGYEFYEDNNSWHISKDVTINFSQKILGIDKKHYMDLRKYLQYMQRNNLVIIRLICIIVFKN